MLVLITHIYVLGLSIREIINGVRLLQECSVDLLRIFDFLSSFLLHLCGGEGDRNSAHPRQRVGIHTNIQREVSRPTW